MSQNSDEKPQQEKQVFRVTGEAFAKTGNTTFFLFHTNRPGYNMCLVTFQGEQSSTPLYGTVEQMKVLKNLLTREIGKAETQKESLES